MGLSVLDHVFDSLFERFVDSNVWLLLARFLGRCRNAQNAVWNRYRLTLIWGRPLERA